MEAPVEALRPLFLDDALSRPLVPEQQMGGVTDRAGHAWVVFDIDGTGGARPRASALYPRPTPYRLFVGGMWSVPQARPGANAGKWYGTNADRYQQTHNFQRLDSIGNKGEERRLARARAYSMAERAS
ncbi:hypothetical protein [Thermogemmatispora onikobensis]|uniref:hypothetical protein n=1 Tax=Thermogemmatispora onikobensis TaxID=732234 RepID=UPI00114CECE2|nr:hypothetical protein [Thermogemmatispora onikobensis]